MATMIQYHFHVCLYFLIQITLNLCPRCYSDAHHYKFKDTITNRVEIQCHLIAYDVTHFHIYSLQFLCFLLLFITLGSKFLCVFLFRSVRKNNHSNVNQILRLASIFMVDVESSGFNMYLNLFTRSGFCFHNLCSALGN